MNQGSNVRIENLFSSLKELQNEKVCLEQKLHEVKLKRHSLEQNLEHANDRYVHVKEKHRRMTETLAVAQQKVDQTLTTSLSLRADIEQSQIKIAELQRTIETEKNMQLQNIKEFEASLCAISSELFHAKDFYKNSALHAEISNTQKSCFDLEQQVERGDRDLQTLTRSLEKLIQDEKSSSFSESGIEKSLFACYRIMKQDKEEAEDYLNQVQGELKEIRDILHSCE